MSRADGLVSVSMRPLTLITSLILLAVALPATPQAATGAYQVELVVFRTGGLPSGGDPASARGLAGGSDIGEGAGAGGSSGRFIGLLVPAAWQLNDVEARLRASGAYRIVAHLGWTQTPSAWGSRAGFPVSRLGAGAESLSGTIYLERGQYLHLGLSLGHGTASINEMRRVRLGEKNYFDNPGFGAIAVVTAAR